jgi:predicted phage replisome organizer
MSKRYYWLKLPEDFFNDDTAQFIEDQENGEAYLLFYLKLCCKSLRNNGAIYRIVGETLMPYNAKALARMTNTDVDTVKCAVELFCKYGIMTILESGEIYMNQVAEMIGTETDKARAMRESRARGAISNNVTKIGNKVTKNGNNVLKCYTERELELESELESDIDKERERESEKKKRRSVRFTPPTRDDVINYCAEKSFEIDADRFIDYYAANGWKVGRNPMKSWKAAVNNWHRRDLEQGWQKRKEEQDPYLKLLEEEETNYITAEVSIFESDGNDPDAGDPKRSIPDNL